MEPPILITGASGCVGTSAVKYMLEHGHTPISFSRSAGSPEGIETIAGDITSLEDISHAIKKVNPIRIIHLAGFQTPDCQAMPFKGMDVNAIGTSNLLRAASAPGTRVDRVVFASSAAVYGSRSLYARPTVTTNDPVLPPGLYGYWKYVGEGMCQAFNMETGASTVSLRFATTYGPGRDRGLTSAPTTALKAAALGIDYDIPYQGREHYHYVDDVGAAFAVAATAPYEGCGAYNLRGDTVETAEFCRKLRSAAEAMNLQPSNIRISEDASAMPFACDLDAEATIQAFPDMPLTPLDQGIEDSLNYFADQAKAGILTNIDS